MKDDSNTAAGSGWMMRFVLRLLLWLDEDAWKKIMEYIPVRVVKMRKPDSLTVKIDLECDDVDGALRVIAIPVNLSEYPDVHRARWLSVRLEMVGGEDTSGVMREVRLHAGLDRWLTLIASNDGIPASRKVDADRETSSRRTTHQPSCQSRCNGMNPNA